MPRRLRSCLRLLLFAAATVAPGTLAAESEGATTALRHLFVTSTTGSGDLETDWVESGGVGGVAGANAICQARAEDAGLAVAGAPEFRAWISDVNTDAWCNVQGLTGKRFGAATVCNNAPLVAVGPWVRTDGVLFGDDLTQLTTNGSYVPPSKDEFGAEVATTTLHWTGTFLNGTRSTADCTGWTVTTGQGQPGSARSTGGWGFSSGLLGCTNAARLVCLEVGVGTPVKKPSGPGHLVFLSSLGGNGDFSSWADTGGQPGLVGADTVCRARATAARLPEPSSFHAWISDSADDAVCRIQGLSGLSASCTGGPPSLDAPYRRTDGFLLADNLAGLLDGQLDTAISVNEQGVHLQASPWTATTSAGVLSSSTETCSNWTLDTGAGRFGTSTSLLSAWTSSGQAGCGSAGFRLYCVSTAVVVFWDTFESGNPDRWSAVSP